MPFYFSNLILQFAKLKAEERININEIKCLMEFIKEDYTKLSAKELRKYDIGYGAMSMPYIF